ncbi:acyl carrier protein [Clostridium guangxiense]|uniref:acyl carrier protein n=1 Tax=Clostridium guangxiense TaxID=1662055 RepID=UPI001E629538|nr:acyl carrier protein [Clostridium guangxiense]MCD2346375.1 acyl carrier protein [Clostridium guangxiense]
MIFEKIKSITAEQLGVDTSTLTMETSFQGDLNADSLDLFQIIMELEDEFNIQIEDTDDINTIGDAVKFIQEKTGEE